MYTLLIDTSCERGFIAIAKEGTILLEKRLFGLFSSRELVPATETLFAQLNISVDDLKAIACGIGPGSFTGIRVGAAFALGLSAGRSLPLISFSSLLGFISPKQHFVSLIPAKIGGVYGMIRERIGDEIQDSAPRFFTPTEFPTAFLGCEEAISPTAYSHSSLILPLVEELQNLTFIANYVESKYSEKNFSLEKLDILYLRGCPSSTLSS